MKKKVFLIKIIFIQNQSNPIINHLEKNMKIFSLFESEKQKYTHI
jgi:hypothetical protein